MLEIVRIVFLRVAVRFADLDEGGEVEHRPEIVGPKGLSHGVLVVEVAADDFPAAHNSLRSRRQIVEDDDLEAFPERLLTVWEPM